MTLMHDVVDHFSDHSKTVLDYASLGVVGMSFIGVLPTLATAASLLWSAIRIVTWLADGGPQSLWRKLTKRKPADSE